MKREILRIVLLLFCVSYCMTGFGKNLPDSVIMTVAGKPIPLSEFIFIAQKNEEADFSNKKSINEYVELFKNFKLKVAEAEARGLDQSLEFKNELEGYRGQLMAGYLSDKEGEEAAAKVIYDRGNEVLELSYLLFLMPEGNTLMKDTLAPYNEANKVYDRLMKGEDIDQVGKVMGQEEKVVYEYVPGLTPMIASKAFEEAVYNLPVGVISKPIRTSRGYYVVKIHSKRPNPGIVSVYHILVSYQGKDSTRTKEESKDLIEKVYKKVLAGEDFAELAKTYSDDIGSADIGGELRPIGPGATELAFEKAAFSMNQHGEISPIIETGFGYHILKFNAKMPRPTFESEKRKLIQTMRQGEHNFELYKAFDDRMKKEYEYVFYPEAYKELETLCNDYFPGERSFFESAKEMKKTLFSLLGENFSQGEFAHYMVSQPFSTKTYGPDFMKEIYELFLRELTTNAERTNLEKKYPEYIHLMQEYRDGILLFEISNKEVWSKPAAEQATIEAEWMNELKKKYPVEINQKALKKLQK